MKGETAERILTSAKTLMIERGYSAFSYADISQAVEITKASIHFHFPTKAGLAVAVLRAHRDELVQAAERLDDAIADPLQRLHAYVSHWEGCIRGRTIPFCVAALLAAELPALPEEVQAEIRLHFHELERWIERTLRVGKEHGSIRLQASPAAEAQMLMAVVHGAMLTARATGGCEVFRITTTVALERLSPHT